MTDTILSNEVIRNAMRMQYENISQQMGKARLPEACEEDVEVYTETQKKYSELFHELSDKLPKELWELVFELDSNLNTIMALTQEFYFRQGVNAGLTKLQFLSERRSVNV